jgi:hypothetical protein
MHDLTFSLARTHRVMLSCFVTDPAVYIALFNHNLTTQKSNQTVEIVRKLQVLQSCYYLGAADFRRG